MVSPAALEPLVAVNNGREASQESIFRWMGREICEISCAAVEPLYQTACAIADFASRHMKAFILYPILALTMYCFSVTTPYIAMTLLPGFGWGLMFTDGNQLPMDFLVEVKAPEQSTTWIPEGNQWEGSIGERRKLTERVKNQLLTNRAPNGWTLLYGDSGVGKTELLKGIGEKIVEAGARVFFLNTSVLRGGRMGADNRFALIATYLNTLALRNPVVLIIDEMHQMIDLRLNDCFKDTAIFPLNFNVLAATTGQNRAQIVSDDPALLTRFTKKQHLVKPLDSEAMIAAFLAVKQARFETIYHVTIADDVIRKTVNVVVSDTEVPLQLKMKWAATLLSLASEDCRGGIVSFEAVKKQVDLHADLQKDQPIEDREAEVPESDRHFLESVGGG